MVALGSHYHVGIVVADIHEARARLAAQLGITWGPIMAFDALECRDGDGADIVLPSVACYSTGTPCIELVQEVPGSVWVRNEHSNLHHIGFWSDEMAADSASLSGVGCPLQLGGRQGDVAPAQFGYHWDPVLGVRIELVDAALRPLMAPLFEPDPAGP